MDTSKKYIKMCEKAVDIQELGDRKKNPHIGDDVYKIGYEYPSIIVDLDEYYDDETWKVKLDDDFAFEDSRDLIWLPRQDQLQRMVPIAEDFKDCLSLFISWLREQGQTEPSYEVRTKFHSMEQLWLAFVMKEKFNKTWDGNEWKGLPPAGKV